MILIKFLRKTVERHDKTEDGYVVWWSIKIRNGFLKCLIRHPGEVSQIAEEWKLAQSRHLQNYNHDIYRGKITRVDR